MSLIYFYNVCDFKQPTFVLLYKSMFEKDFSLGEGEKRSRKEGRVRINILKIKILMNKQIIKKGVKLQPTTRTDFTDLSEKE